MGTTSSSNFDTANASKDLFPNPSTHKEIKIYFTQRTTLGGYLYFVIISQNDTELFHHFIRTSSSQSIPANASAHAKPKFFRLVSRQILWFQIVHFVMEYQFLEKRWETMQWFILLHALDVCLSPRFLLPGNHKNQQLPKT